MKVIQYIKNRLSERTSAAGLAVAAVYAATAVFPEYALLITQVAAALGVTAAALPTGGKV